MRNEWRDADDLADHRGSASLPVVIQKLRELLEANPVRPFSVALADGRRCEVTSLDVIWMPDEGRGGRPA